MTSNRLLAALVGEFGRSLIAVAELMSEEQDEAIETVPVKHSMGSMQHLRQYWPGRDEALKEINRKRKKTGVLEPLGDLPLRSKQLAEIEFPLPQRPLDLTSTEGDESDLNKTERKILVTLAQFVRPMTAEQIGFYCGLAHKGGSFQDALRGLVTDELVQRAPPNFGPKHYVITERGLTELGEYTPLPQGDALFEFWCNKLGTTSEKILRALKPEPAGITMAVLGEETGLAHKGGSFQDAVRGLRKMQLVVKSGAIVQLSNEFRRAVAPTINVLQGSRTLKVDARKGHVR